MGRYILSFDIEEAQHSNIEQATIFPKQNIEENIKAVLHYLEKHSIKAVFFVVGETAVRYPKAICMIAERGHEIAAHGMTHRLVYQMTEKEFRFDVRECKKTLEGISGVHVRGYRAPSWSLHTKKTPWAWRILHEEGYAYSSSVMPFQTFLYGENNFPHARIRISLGGIWPEEILARQYDKDSFIEIPVSTTSLFGKKIPFSGGFYFRLFPWWFIVLAARTVPAPIFYFHLRDIADEIVPHGISWKAYLIQYARRQSGKKKFLKLLSQISRARL